MRQNALRQRREQKIRLQEQSCVVLIAGVLSLIIETRSLCSRIKEKIRRVQVSFQLVNAL